MRLSEFWDLADAVFGESYSRTLARELSLDDFDSLTPAAALEAGRPPRDVWHAWCEQMSVPVHQRDGGDDRRMVPPPRR
ncbi:DUF3046 domain-containing protein [Demequina mangrovi]|uniref:DUF3046 domain-containing protein n=1 Tax=Demequina mangrovi TaxID=1043493 RepID=A0A1H6Z6Q0_9MICO|nr:DUF3046 domain-containing protein [Demequina mangrovi]SEJ47674.1 Protein of unknown function [Demequina mangrovi]